MDNPLQAAGAARGIEESAVRGIGEGAVRGIEAGAAQGIGEGAVRGIGESAVRGIGESAARGIHCNEDIPRLARKDARPCVSTLTDETTTTTPLINHKNHSSDNDGVSPLHLWGESRGEGECVRGEVSLILFRYRKQRKEEQILYCSRSRNSFARCA
jgi:hypothetical protein